MENPTPVYQTPPNPAPLNIQPEPQPSISSSNNNQAPTASPQKSNTKKLLWAVLAIITLIIAIYVTYIASTVYVVTKLDKAYVVDGPSMAPALNNGDRVLVANYNVLNTKLLNTSTSVNDIVVFPTTFQGKSFSLIKRVVAVGGQRVVISNNKLAVYDTAHPSGYDPTIAYEPNGEVTAGSTDTVVPAGKVFVLGDNRPNSLDSRAFGSIPQSSLIGKVIGKISQP